MVAEQVLFYDQKQFEFLEQNYIYFYEKEVEIQLFDQNSIETPAVKETLRAKHDVRA